MQVEILVARQDIVARWVLEHDTNLLAHFRRLSHDVEARYRGAATIEAKQRRQHRNGGGLAGAIGAKQAENFAFGDVEVEVVNRDEIAEALRQTVGLNHSHRRATRRGDLKAIVSCHAWFTGFRIHGKWTDENDFARRETDCDDDFLG